MIIQVLTIKIEFSHTARKEGQRRGVNDTRPTERRVLEKFPNIFFPFEKKCRQLYKNGGETARRSQSTFPKFITFSRELAPNSIWFGCPYIRDITHVHYQVSSYITKTKLVGESRRKFSPIVFQFEPFLPNFQLVIWAQLGHRSLHNRPVGEIFLCWIDPMVTPKQ